MDKFYVKPKKNSVSNKNASSRIKHSTDTTTSRNSEEIFQSSSNVKRLGVGNICSKIRHKIEDNLTPKISAKLYKSGKHSKSLTAISSIGSTTGKYTLTDKNKLSTQEAEIEEVKTKMKKSNVQKDNNNNCSEDRLQSPYAECYNSTTGFTFSKSLSPYIDSDEDETQLSLNIAKTSLEDEIFKELEKAAHDESKLNEVLRTFDKIIFDYNDPQIQEKSDVLRAENTESKSFTDLHKLKKPCVEDTLGESFDNPISDGYPTSNCLNLDDENNYSRPINIKTRLKKKLEKSSSTLSLTRKKCYQSPDSPCLRQMRRAFEKQERSKSVWELSNATKIPILKSMPLKTRSKSFCYESTDNSKQQSLQKAWKPLKPPFSDQKNVEDSSKNQKATRPSVTKNRGLTRISSKKKECLPCLNKHPLAKTNFQPISQNYLYPERRIIKSDELLDKCLEKGQQILRKVESINTQRSHEVLHGTKSLHRTKSNSKRKITKDNLTPPKRMELLEKLNYANEEKNSSPPFESCRIIPPVLGQTSDKHVGLLVQVINASKLITSPKKNATIESGISPIQSKGNIDLDHAERIIKCEESDSDDSGHISNENMEIAINPTFSSLPSISTTSIKQQSSAKSKTKENSPNASEQLKFNAKKIVHLKPELENLNTKYETENEFFKNVSDYRYCTTYKIAEIESVSVVRTHLEIYPNYTKEIIMSLH